MDILANPDQIFLAGIGAAVAFDFTRYITGRIRADWKRLSAERIARNQAPSPIEPEAQTEAAIAPTEPAQAQAPEPAIAPTEPEVEPAPAAEPAPKPEPETPDALEAAIANLEAQTVPALRKLASELGVSIRSGGKALRKAELIQALALALTP